MYRYTHLAVYAIIIKIYQEICPPGGVRVVDASHIYMYDRSLQIYVPYIISVPVFHALYDRGGITGMGSHSARAV